MNFVVWFLIILGVTSMAFSMPTQDIYLALGGIASLMAGILFSILVEANNQ